MSAKYLLTCDCGRQIVVGPPQAGETIACSCGARLDVPNMLEMAALQPATTEDKAPRSDRAWGWRQRMLLIGGLLLPAAIVLGSLRYANRPRSPFENVDPEYIKLAARQFSPWQTWDSWETMKRGLNRQTDEKFIRDREIYGWELAGIAVVALLGVGLVACGLAQHRSADSSGVNEES